MKPTYIRLGKLLSILGKVILYLLLWLGGVRLHIGAMEAVTRSPYADPLCSIGVAAVPGITAWSVWFIRDRFSEWYTRSIFGAHSVLLVVPLYVIVLWFYIGFSITLAYIIPIASFAYNWLFDDFGFVIMLSVAGVFTFAMLLGRAILKEKFARSIPKATMMAYVGLFTLASIGLLFVGCLAFLLEKEVSGWLGLVIILVLFYLVFMGMCYVLIWVVEKFEGK